MFHSIEVLCYQFSSLPALFLLLYYACFGIGGARFFFGGLKRQWLFRHVGWYWNCKEGSSSSSNMATMTNSLKHSWVRNLRLIIRWKPDRINFPSIFDSTTFTHPYGLSKILRRLNGAPKIRKVSLFHTLSGSNVANLTI